MNGLTKYFLFLFAASLLTLAFSPESAPAETRRRQEQKTVVFTLYSDDTPIQGAVLSLHDRVGLELERGESDSLGQVSLRYVEGGRELRLKIPGEAERVVRLPAGLAERGGDVEYRRVRPGVPFTLELGVISGTGYTWELAPGGDVRQTGSEVIYSTRSKLLGAAAGQRLTLVAPADQGQALLVYRRSWEHNVLPIRWRVLLLG